MHLNNLKRVELYSQKICILIFVGILMRHEKSLILLINERKIQNREINDEKSTMVALALVSRFLGIVTEDESKTAVKTNGNYKR